MHEHREDEHGDVTDFDPALDYIEILGVSSDDDATEIKRRYRELLLKLHPDRTPGNDAADTEGVADVVQAYRVLTDENLRRKWESARRALLEADANVWKRFKLKLEDLENGWSEECRD